LSRRRDRIDVATASSAIGPRFAVIGRRCALANYSNLTRKEQVYNYLKVRINSWVDGPELANEVVGGSEGLKRLRELRAELSDSRFDIEMRGHPDPDRDVFQYRLVERPVEAPAYTEPAPAAPMQVAPAPPSERPPSRQNAPARRSTFQNPRGHLVYDEETATYVAVVDGEPPVTQPSMGVPTDDGLKYSVMPERLDFGKSRPCPKCHGIHRSLKGTDGRVIKGQYEKRTRNPHKPGEDCPRCNGFGLIPA
jgi:hypothetical protein